MIVCYHKSTAVISMTDLLNSVNVVGTSGVKFGTGATLVTLAASVSTGRTYTISDASANANFMMDTGGGMTISGSTTIGYVLTGLTSTTANWQASSVGGGTSELLTLSSSSGTQANLTLTKNYTEVTVNSGVTPLGYVFWGSKGSGTSGAVNQGNCVAVDVNSNSVYITGWYNTTFTLYSSGNTAFSPSLAMVGSNNNSFIAKFNDRGIVQWALSITQTGTVKSNGICVSSSTGNIYITGTYTLGTLTFNNSDGTAFTTLAAATSTNVFISCYNSSGFGLWVAYLGGSSGCFQATLGNGVIAVNPATENIYVASYTANATTTMYNSNGTSFTTHSLVGTNDCIFSCYNRTGFGIWLSAAVGGTAELPTVAVNTSSGNIYFSGLYSSAFTLYNPGAVSSGKTLTITGSLAMFVAAYNNLGNALWTAKVDGASVTAVAGTTGVCVNNTTGNVCAMTNFTTHTVTLYNSSGSSSGITIASSGGTSSTFSPLVTYNSAGTVQWGANASSTSNLNYSYGLCLNSITGAIYLGGTYTTNVTIYNSGGGTFATLSNTLASSYFAAYTSAGAAFWAVTNTGSQCYSLCANPNNNTMFHTGILTGTPTLKNSDGTSSSVSLSAIGTNDVIICCYDNLVTNYSLPTGTVDPTTKTLLFQNNATTKGVIIVVPAGTNQMYSTLGKVVYRLYFTATGNKVALTWTNSFWTIQGNLNVPVITA